MHLIVQWEARVSQQVLCYVIYVKVIPSFEMVKIYTHFHKIYTINGSKTIPFEAVPHTSVGYIGEYPPDNSIFIVSKYTTFQLTCYMDLNWNKVTYKSG